MPAPPFRGPAVRKPSPNQTFPVSCCRLALFHFYIFGLVSFFTLESPTEEKKHVKHFTNRRPIKTYSLGRSPRRWMVLRRKKILGARYRDTQHRPLGERALPIQSNLFGPPSFSDKLDGLCKLFLFGSLLSFVADGAREREWEGYFLVSSLETTPSGE